MPNGGPSSVRSFAALSLPVLAASLLAVDGFLILGNLIHVAATDQRNATGDVWSDPAWDGNLDGSYVELFGHVQLIVAVVGLVAVWHRRRAAVHAVWAIVLGAVVADDFLALHERGGAALVRVLALPAVAGLRPQDLGEISIWAAAALVLGPALLVSHLRARGPDRRHSRMLIMLMLALACFAVALDVVHYAADSWLPRMAGRALTGMETAGELGVMTAILLAVYAMVVRPVDEVT